MNWILTTLFPHVCVSQCSVFLFVRAYLTKYNISYFLTVIFTLSFTSHESNIQCWCWSLEWVREREREREREPILLTYIFAFFVKFHLRTYVYKSFKKCPNEVETGNYVNGDTGKSYYMCMISILKDQEFSHSLVVKFNCTLERERKTLLHSLSF